MCVRQCAAMSKLGAGRWDTGVRGTKRERARRISGHPSFMYSGGPQRERSLASRNVLGFSALDRRPDLEWRLIATHRAHKQPKLYFDASAVRPQKIHRTYLCTPEYVWLK
jgi:hypothetical protein